MNYIIMIIVGTIILLSGVSAAMYYAYASKSNTDKADAGPIHREGLLASVFTLSKDIETMTVLKKYYHSDQNSQNYVIQPARTLNGPLWLFDSFPKEKKMIVVPSLQDIEDSMDIAEKYSVDVIAYDIEHWQDTPAAEQKNISNSIMEGAALVHASGYQFGVTPDTRFLVEAHQEIDWREVDLLVMQLQRYSADTAQFLSYTQQIGNHVKRVNPEIELYVQLSFRFTNADEMIEAIEAAKEHVDGFLIAYLPSTNNDSCLPYCNPAALDRVLSRIQVLNRMN
jgi:hypothetical protein